MQKVKLIALCFLIIGFSPFLNAQDPANIDTSSSRKVLLHFDKDSYYPGDTIFFKAYLYTDYTLDQSTTNLFIALYDERGEKIVQKHFPVLGGFSSGNLELSDSIPHGLYYFQALTPALLMNDDSIGYLRQVFVLNPSKVSEEYNKVQPRVYTINYYPQGGNLIEGLSNQVNYEASDQYGNPVSVKGKLLDENGNLVTEFSDAKGKGSFFFLPELKSYSSSVSFNEGEEKKIVLPVVKAQGVTIRIMGNQQNKSYLVESNLERTPGLELWGIMNGRPVLQQPLKNGNSFTGLLPTSKLPSGILFLAVADKDGNLYAETRLFIDNKEYLRKAELIIDSLDMDASGQNVITFDLKDSLWAGFSLSIVDPEKAEPLFGIPGNIIEDALFNNERAGLRQKSGRSDTPFVTSFNWKQPDWKKIFLGTPASPKIVDDFISIRGTVYKQDTRKIVSEGQVNFLVSTKDSVNTFMFIPLEQDGRFELTNLVFEDTASFLFQMNKGKGGPISIVLDPPVYKLPSRLPVKMIMPYLNHDLAIISDTTRNNPIVAAFVTLNPELDKYKTLEEVVVVAAKKRNPTILVNQRYTSGLFSNMSQARVIDFITDPPKTSGNVFDYIASKIPGIRITRRGIDYVLESPRALSIGNMTMGGNGLVDGKFYLNEMEVQSRDISFLQLSDIALIKYFPPGTSIIADGGIAPVLAIYTRQNDDQLASFRAMSKFRYPGYSPSDLYYDDDFSQYYKGNKGVILWKPDLYLAGESNKLTIRFRNPYKTRSMRIILQGVTTDGELIYFEKTISK